MEPRTTIFLGMTWLDAATIAAILIGPLLAVIVTRLRDRWREKRERRTALFRSLMRTRPMRLDREHVASLNLVEIEFYGVRKVLDPFRAYLNHLSAPMPMPDEQARFFEARNDLFVAMLKAMGEELGYSFDKHDLARLAYAPRGWEMEENQMRRNAALLTELLEGRRPLPITPMVASNQSQFPPPPQVPPQEDLPDEVD